MGDDPAYRRTLSLQNPQGFLPDSPIGVALALSSPESREKLERTQLLLIRLLAQATQRSFTLPPYRHIPSDTSALITYINTFFSGESHSQPHIVRLLYHVSRKLGYTQNKTGVKSNLFYFLLLHPSCIERNCYGGTCHLFTGANDGRYYFHPFTSSSLPSFFPLQGSEQTFFVAHNRTSFCMPNYPTS